MTEQPGLHVRPIYELIPDILCSMCEVQEKDPENCSHWDEGWNTARWPKPHPQHRLEEK